MVQPGKGKAVASLVLGIIALVCSLFGLIGSIIGLVCAIVGLVLASGAKKEGFVGGMATAGLVCSIIGLILCAVTFIACAACASALESAGSIFDY